jgi:phage terminase Nu1 subunit (DNA packaging protein)
MDADAESVLGPDPSPPTRKAATQKHVPRNRSATTDPAYLAEKIRLANAQAVKVELQNAQARKELLPAKAVEAEWSAILRDVRAGMLAIPSRVQQRLPHLSAHDVSEIDREIRDALSELAENL